jgi:pyruvate/2-oxoacid:ferredoxin oxidoreductase alpha subunit
MVETDMSKVQIINGNETAAMGAKLCRVQVIAA